MKKMISLIIMMLLVLMFPFRLKAPAMVCLIITESEPIYIFNIKDPVLRAFVRFESFYDEYAVNPVSGARGIVQFLPVMINEVNRIQKEREFILSYLLNCSIKLVRFTFEDAFNVQKSIDMWYIVQRYHNPTYDIQKACQIWFGLGVQWDGLTWIGYNEKIQKFI